MTLSRPDGRGSEPARLETIGHRITQKGEPFEGHDVSLDSLVSRGRPSCDLATKESFKDFDLELEWRVSPGGSSGVMFDVAESDEPSYHTGPEMQVLDDGGHPDGKRVKKL